MIRTLALRKSVLEGRATTALTIAVLRSSAIAAKFGITLFIARFLDLEVLGSYGLVVGAAVVVPVLVGLGMIEVLGREAVGQELDEVTAALVPYWTYAAALYLAIALAVLPWAHAHDQASILILIVVLIFVEHLNTDILVVLNRRQRPRLANLLFTFRSTAWIASYVALAFFFPALRSLFFVLAFWLVGTTTALVCFFWTCRDWPWRSAFSYPLGRTRLWTLIRNSRTLYLNDIANTGGQYVDRYIVSAFLGLEAAGIYFFFWSFANALSNLVDTSLLQVQQPAIILSRLDPRRQGHLLNRLRIEAAGISLAIGLLTAGLAYLAITIVPYARFGDQAVVFLVLLLGFVLRMAYEVEGIGLYSRHEDWNTLLSALIVFGVSLSVTTVLLPILGLLGPAIAVVLSYLIGGLWRWQRNRFVVRSSWVGRRAEWSADSGG